jgi:hypothetical protein
MAAARPVYKPRGVLCPDGTRRPLKIPLTFP